ncbi:MAG: hypothetical protein JO001_23510 [Alphaproteobacteria bacterium]|nr:hypothetical protein [Alphaproteobacteria bacterium]
MARSGKQPHILNASTNLIGICFVIIAGLKITNVSDRTFADEICIVSAFGFLCACGFSYASLRASQDNDRYEKAADYLFLGSLLLLFVDVVLFARNAV